MPYDGEVWCATVPNGTLLVRRGGKVSFCGNCLWREHRLAFGLPAPEPYSFDILKHGLTSLRRIEELYDKDKAPE